MVRLLLLFTVCVIPAISTVSCDPSTSDPPDEGTVRVGSQTLSVDFLLTNDERITGVRNHPLLSEGRGVLFVYPEPVPKMYWANRTRLKQELSLAFVAPDQTIRSIKRMTPNGSTSVASGGPAQFMILVPSGWFEKHRIASGDRIEVPQHVIDAAEPVFTLPDQRGLTVGDRKIDVEVARTSSERAMGLMYRKALPEHQGMLFVYRKSGIRRFHMKNTLIPLDIAFISSSGTIQEIKQMHPLNTSTVSSSRPAMYVLEMRQGWFQDHGIKEGQTVILNSIRSDLGKKEGNEH